jgi:beta-glucuronidase
MTLRLRPLLIALVCTSALAVPALAQTPPPGGQPGPPPPPPTPKLKVERPGKKGILVREGASGRYKLGGTWYFRQDDVFAGDKRKYFRQRSLKGWTKVHIPHNWNGADTTLNKATVGWYRYEFRLPKGQGSSRLQWKLRFESVNHRATVYLNGKRLAQHGPGYLPFEVVLHGLKRGKRNRLVVKVSTLRGSTDLTHWRRAKFNGFGTGGWWNFGGISREVYLRRIDGVDIERVRTTPRIGCPRCSVNVTVRVRLRNFENTTQRVQVALFLRSPKSKRSRRVRGGTATLRPHQIREVTKKVRIRRPRLWQPGSPRLYGLQATAASQGRRRASYRLTFGVKVLKVLPDGTLLLNGHRLDLRGASIHEDDIGTGAALSLAQRNTLIKRLKEVGGTVARSQYPLHPDFMEAFDRAGILFWSQAPVYQIPPQNTSKGNVLRNAVRVNRETVLAEENHPSVLVWSVANELPQENNPAQQRFIGQAANAVRRLDPTRLVGLDRQSQLGQADPIPAVRSSIDVLGVNDYFGWYNASLIPNRPSRNSDLGPFLDHLHQIYPGKPMLLTEFGAESNRSGAATQRGTFQFQTAWLNSHLAQAATRPFVSGEIAWLLKDFRVHPTWAGGNPLPTPPWNNKGLIDENGTLKPAFFAMQAQWRRTRPLR